VLGRRLGNKAILAGAVFGTLPDLDVLVPFSDAVASFTYHRSFSHSWVVLSVLSFACAALCHRLNNRCSYWHWWLMIFLALNTHVLLDCFTVYGTQALWPLSNYPIGFSTIFIIDPLYTLPLIAGLIVAMRRQPTQKSRVVANTLGLTLSTAYLCWTVFAHQWAEQRVVSALTDSEIDYQAIHTSPSPFSLLWRFVVLTEGDYLEGFISLADSPEHPIALSRYPRNDALARQLQDHWPVTRLQWFTQGFYRLSESEQVIYMTDLRMGLEASYVFSFRVAERDDSGALLPITSELVPFMPDLQRIKKVFKRMLDESISLLPAAANT